MSNFNSDGGERRYTRRQVVDAAALAALGTAAAVVFGPAIVKALPKVPGAIGNGINTVNRDRLQNDYDAAVQAYDEALDAWRQRVQPMAAVDYLGLVGSPNGQANWQRLEGYREGSVGGTKRIPVAYLLSGAFIRPATQPREVNPTGDNFLAGNVPLQVQWFELFAAGSDPYSADAPRAYVAAYEGNAFEHYRAIGAEGARVEDILVVAQPHTRETETSYDGSLHAVNASQPYQNMAYQGTLTVDNYYAQPNPPQKPAGL